MATINGRGARKASMTARNTGGGNSKQGLAVGIGRNFTFGKNRAFGKKKDRESVWLNNKKQPPKENKNAKFRKKFQDYISYIFKSSSDNDATPTANKIFKDIKDWDTSGVTKMEWLFVTELSQQGKPFINWDDKNVKQTQKDAVKAALNKIYSWDTSNVTSMRGLFFNATIITSLPNDIFETKGWNTSNVRDMSYMFCKTRLVKWSGDKLLLKTNHVRNMSSMFKEAESFTQELEFNTENVENMSSMFDGAESFNTELQFNTENVENMSSMFKNASRFNNGNNHSPLKFYAPKVKDMSSMFDGAESFNTELQFHINNVADMSSMFKNAKAFNNGEGTNKKKKTT